MLAAVKGEAEEIIILKVIYLLKIEKQKSNVLLYPERKTERIFSYPPLKRTIMRSNLVCVVYWARPFFTKIELILICTEKGCCRAVKELMHIPRTALMQSIINFTVIILVILYLPFPSFL